MPTLLSRPALGSAARSRRLSRRGLTLLELLIVLVIMSVGAGLVVFNRSVVGVAPDDDVLTRARRTAVARAERLSLVVGPDGAWELRSLRGEVLERGRHAGGATDVAVDVGSDVQIDPLGSCSAAVSRTSQTFNPLTCSWQAGVR